MHVNVGFLFTNVWTEKDLLQPGNSNKSLTHFSNLLSGLRRNRQMDNKGGFKGVHTRCGTVNPQLN